MPDVSISINFKIYFMFIDATSTTVKIGRPKKFI